LQDDFIIAWKGAKGEGAAVRSPPFGSVIPSPSPLTFGGALLSG